MLFDDIIEQTLQPGEDCDHIIRVEYNSQEISNIDIMTTVQKLGHTIQALDD